MIGGCVTSLRQRTLPISLFVIGLVLFACTKRSTPGDFEDALYIVTLEAVESISAGQILLRYNRSDYEFKGLLPSQASMLVQAYDDGAGTLAVGFVASSPVSDGILELNFREQRVGRSDLLLEAKAYDESGELVTNGVQMGSSRRSSARQVTLSYDPYLRAQSLKQSLRPLAGDASREPELEASFANHPLGDVNKDGTVDVLDALRVLHIAAGQGPSPTDYELYHADFTGTGRVDVLDVLKLLTKAVDPSLPAQLHVAPVPTSFMHVQENRPLLLGNLGNKPLPQITYAVSPELNLAPVDDAGIADHSLAYEISFSSNSPLGRVEFDARSAGYASVPVGNIALLIVGQSNASGHGRPIDDAELGISAVRMFANDYIWKQAYEPLDDPEGQVDSVSKSDPTYHSFGVRLGKELHAATGRYIYFITGAKNGSRVAHWLPTSDRLNRGSLFGSANYRAQTSAGTVQNSYPAKGGPVSAVIWFQGESDRHAVYRDRFVDDTNAVLDAFAEELASPAVIFIQLAANQGRSSNELQQIIREFQRLTESGVQVSTGTGDPQPREDSYMVVAHDLPLSDSVHLSAEGQRILGERIALAYRQHVLAENINGTGPRLVSITQPNESTVKVKTTRRINDHHDYDSYFSVRTTVVDDDGTVRVEDVPITSMRRDPNDDTAVLLTLSEAAHGDVTVRYMPPPDRPLQTQLKNVVQDGDGLPLPAFGTHGVK